VEKKSVIRTISKGLASAAIAVAFCFVPAVLLYQNIDTSGAQTLTRPATVAPSTNGNYGLTTAVNPSTDSAVCVTFEFLGLNTASSYANFGIVVGHTPEGVGHIDTLIQEGYTTPFLLISSNSGLSSIVIQFPLSALQKDDASTTCTSGKPTQDSHSDNYRVLQSIFVLGQPRAFPDDWYQLNDTVSVYLCRAKQAENECTTGLNLQGAIIQPGSTLPTSLVVATDDQDLTMSVSRGPLPTLQFVLQRSGWFVAYTYIVAAMPFLLIILLFTAYALNRSTKGKKSSYSPAREVPAVYEIAFGVAATLVAILPLRAVLVPSSLPNLTRLDICFGTGAALLVALSVDWVFLWKRPENPQPSSEEHP
jgi:hypothetical protein